MIVFSGEGVAMTDGLASIKRILEAAVSRVATHVPGTRGPLRGRDFMLDDLTHGADHGR
jgi:hypothetical protein